MKKILGPLLALTLLLSACGGPGDPEATPTSLTITSALSMAFMSPT